MAKTPKPASKKPTGRPSLYTEELADTICARLAEGESLRAICRDTGMNLSTVMRWVGEFDSFKEQYARAMQTRADVKFEELDEVSEEAVKAETAVEVNGLRLKADNIKWQLGRMNPKKYGDKLALGGAEDLPPIKTMSDTQLMSRIAALQAKVDGRKVSPNDTEDGSGS